MSHRSTLARHRAPRVHMEYEVEINGVTRKIELPFVTGVMADLSGKPLEPISDRAFIEINKENFDSLMAAMRPRVAFVVPITLTGEGMLAVDITFGGIADFSPAAVARQIEPLRKLLEARQRIADATRGQENEADTGDRPVSPGEAASISSLTNEYVVSIMSQHIADYTDYILYSPPSGNAEAAETIAGIDRKIGEQLNLILHADDFQRLESTWRGLHYLVNHTETDEMLKIRVMNISKKELGKMLKKFKGTSWDQSPIFNKFYRDEYNCSGGRPFGCLVGDYYFDHNPQDIELLGEMAEVCAAAHTPFLAAASPSVMNMESWQELPNPRDLSKIFMTPEYAAWRALRDSEDARYLALTLPRFLARQPYGPSSLAVEEFAFEEDTGDLDHTKFLWANSAYLMAVNIHRSFKTHGWCSRIRGLESGGAIEGLPEVKRIAADGALRMLCPTEVEIDNRRENELARNGFVALVHRKDSDVAVFFSAISLYKPNEYDDPDATARARAMTNLPYLFAICRVAHYLKAITSDKFALQKSSDSYQRWLKDWIANYVDADAATPNAFAQSPRPFAAAEIIVEEVEGNPGYYTSKFFVRPND